MGIRALEPFGISGRRALCHRRDDRASALAPLPDGLQRSASVPDREARPAQEIGQEILGTVMEVDTKI
jgi:hypothetical protein